MREHSKAVPDGARRTGTCDRNADAVWSQIYEVCPVGFGITKRDCLHGPDPITGQIADAIP